MKDGLAGRAAGKSEDERDELRKDADDAHDEKVVAEKKRRQRNEPLKPTKKRIIKLKNKLKNMLSQSQSS